MHSVQPSELRLFGGRRLFLTGGTGFIGRTLLDRINDLAAADSSERPDVVCVLSRDPEAFLRRFPAYASLSWLRFHRGDISTYERPAGAFDDVIHGAAETHTTIGMADWVRQIVAGTHRTLDIALEIGCERFLLISSGAVYGTQHADYATEDDTIAPTPMMVNSTYGQSKRLAEQLCTIYGAEHQLQVVIARCFAVLGTHMPLDGPYAAGNFFRDALAHRPIQIQGNPETIRSYLYGSDLAHWLAVLLRVGNAGEAYNVGSDEACSLLELANLVRNRIDADGRVVCLAKLQTGLGRSRYVPCIDKARHLGLSVNVPLREAVDLTASLFMASPASDCSFPERETTMRGC